MKDKLESLAQSAKDSVGGGAGAVRDAVCLLYTSDAADE